MKESVYMPILKSKQNEMLALKRLKSGIRAAVLPCIDLAAPSKENDVVKAREFVARNIEQLASRIRNLSTVLLDSSEIDADLRLNGGSHPLVMAAVGLHDAGVGVIPVVGLYRDADHINAAKQIVGDLDLSIVAMRLDSYDIDTPSQTAKQYRDFVNTHFSKEKVILVFDCGPIRAGDIHILANSIASLDNKIASKSNILKVVAASAIPANISEVVPTKSAAYLDRLELKLFRAYRAAATNDESGPTIFGDYATVHPNYVELDWKLINRTISPRIAYALKDRWFVIRGGSFRNHPDGYAQYHDLASQVRQLPGVSAPSFSFADEFIDDCAAQLAGPSGPGYWAGVCVNRHISITADLAMKGKLI